MHECGIKNDQQTTSLQDGVRGRGREETSRMFTYLANCYWLIP